MTPLSKERAHVFSFDTMTYDLVRPRKVKANVCGRLTLSADKNNVYVRTLFLYQDHCAGIALRDRIRGLFQ